MPPVRLHVRHATTYTYERPVSFGEHRLMFRPRDSHDQRLVSATLSIKPPARVRWYHDVFSNSIAIAEFSDAADELRFISEIVVDHYGRPDIEFPVDDFARTLPFDYSIDDAYDLARTTERHYPDPNRDIDAWARGFLNPDGTGDTTEVLTSMTRAIKAQFGYARRYEPGTQTPCETLASGGGTCRDYALFMMEAVRSLGLAARFVSGYVYDPALDSGGPEMVGAGATHAWVQAYLPGAGWVEFDPTNGIVGSHNLIRVAVARDPSQAIPLQGTYEGDGTEFLNMDVDVRVTSLDLDEIRPVGREENRTAS